MDVVSLTTLPAYYPTVSLDKKQAVTFLAFAVRDARLKTPLLQV